MCEKCVKLHVCDMRVMCVCDSCLKFDVCDMCVYRCLTCPWDLMYVTWVLYMCVWYVCEIWRVRHVCLYMPKRVLCTPKRALLPQKEPCVVWNLMSKKCMWWVSYEPCIPQKEPCKPPKEPYVPQKEPRIPQQELHVYAVSNLMCHVQDIMCTFCMWRAFELWIV